MAVIVGCLAMSHAPQLMLNPDQWHLLNAPRFMLPLEPELQNVAHEVKWKRWNRCMEAINRLRARLDELRPDTVVIVGDDQHENFIDDGMPPFVAYIGEEVEASVSLRYLSQSMSENRTRYKVDSSLAHWTVTDLMENGFDPAYCKQTRYAGGLGHAFARVLRFLAPDAQYSVLPIMVNTYHPPAPSAKRCVQFGRALALAIDRFEEPRRVVIVASGGLSHTKIDLRLDRDFIRCLEQGDIGQMETLPDAELVDGTSEIRNWILTAAAAGRPATMLEYQPLPRVPAGAGCAMGFAEWR